MGNQREKLFEKTVRDMAQSISEQAMYAEISLEGMTYENFNDFIDEEFGDGGEVRCEYFTDLAMEYALEFGPIESYEFNVARHECIKEAIRRIQENY